MPGRRGTSALDSVLPSASRDWFFASADFWRTKADTESRAKVPLRPVTVPARSHRRNPASPPPPNNGGGADDGGKCGDCAGTERDRSSGILPLFSRDQLSRVRAGTGNREPRTLIGPSHGIPCRRGIGVRGPLGAGPLPPTDTGEAQTEGSADVVMGRRGSSVLDSVLPSASATGSSQALTFSGAKQTQNPELRSLSGLSRFLLAAIAGTPPVHLPRTTGEVQMTGGSAETAQGQRGTSVLDSVLSSKHQLSTAHTGARIQSCGIGIQDGILNSSAAPSLLPLSRVVPRERSGGGIVAPWLRDNRAARVRVLRAPRMSRNLSCHASSLFQFPFPQGKGLGVRSADLTLTTETTTENVHAVRSSFRLCYSRCA